jgi:hypothetical protein
MSLKSSIFANGNILLSVLRLVDPLEAEKLRAPECSVCDDFLGIGEPIWFCDIEDEKTELDITLADNSFALCSREKTDLSTESLIDSA